MSLQSKRGIFFISHHQGGLLLKNQTLHPPVLWFNPSLCRYSSSTLFCMNWIKRVWKETPLNLLPLPHAACCVKPLCVFFFPQTRRRAVVILQRGRGERPAAERGPVWESGVCGGGRQRGQKEDHVVPGSGEIILCFGSETHTENMSARGLYSRREMSEMLEMSEMSEMLEMFEMSEMLEMCNSWSSFCTNHPTPGIQKKSAQLLCQEERDDVFFPSEHDSMFLSHFKSVSLHPPSLPAPPQLAHWYDDRRRLFM